jgi:transcriptional regulator with XRE-family HTH domain
VSKLERSYGRRLRDLRGQRSYSLVAQAIGVSADSLSRWEQGRNVPSDANADALRRYYAGELRCPPEDLAWIVEDRRGAVERIAPQAAGRPARRPRRMPALVLGIVVISVGALALLIGTGSLGSSTTDTAVPEPGKATSPGVDFSKPGDPGDELPAALVGAPVECRLARPELRLGFEDDDSMPSYYAQSLSRDEDILTTALGRLEADRLDFPGSLRPYVRAERAISSLAGYAARPDDMPVAFRWMHELYYGAAGEYAEALQDVIRRRRRGRPAEQAVAALDAAKAEVARAAEALDYCTGGSYAYLEGAEYIFSHPPKKADGGAP